MKNNIKVEFIHQAGFESRHALFRIPPLTFPVLATATPPDVEFFLTNKAYESIDFDKNVDLVGISVILPFTPKA
jgi:hypothetical protein